MTASPDRSQPGIELLPCPFCGGEEISVYDDRGKTMFWASCRSCGLEAPTETGLTGDDAVAYWNTRATPAQPAGMPDKKEADDAALREALERLIYDDVKADIETEADATNAYQEGYSVGFNDCRYRVLHRLLEHGVALALPAERPAVAQAGWMPIETYDPAHELNVLVVDEGVVSEAYYNGESDAWFKEGKSEHDFDFVSSDRLFPTHWMPMPAPPPSPHSSTVREGGK